MNCCLGGRGGSTLGPLADFTSFWILIKPGACLIHSCTIWFYNLINNVDDITVFLTIKVKNVINFLLEKGFKDIFMNRTCHSWNGGSLVILLLYCYIVILLYCYIVILLYCYIVILFWFCLDTIFGNKKRFLKLIFFTIYARHFSHDHRNCSWKCLRF